METKMSNSKFKWLWNIYEIQTPTKHTCHPKCFNQHRIEKYGTKKDAQREGSSHYMPNEQKEEGT